MNQNSDPNLDCKARFGVAYRNQKTAWKIAPYPLRATPGSAQKLIEWLQSNPEFKTTEMIVVKVSPVKAAQ